MARITLPPYPNGWFAVAHADQIEPGVGGNYNDKDGPVKGTAWRALTDAARAPRAAATLSSCDGGAAVASIGRRCPPQTIGGPK